ncbi:MAG: hypothetical protein MN733_06545, partial [Nitrososphaera sp.]|nr:hypothetical protein [Nitrososphaera sp.]
SATTLRQARTLIPHALPPAETIRMTALARNYPSIRKVKVNYILLKGFNDSLDDAERLIAMLTGHELTVKVSVLNTTEASAKFGLVPASLNDANCFTERLHAAGLDTYIYGAFNGTTVSCGQLVGAQERDNK